jgi:hypothetical protein
MPGCRLGQRSEASTGAGKRSTRRRWLAPSPATSCGGAACDSTLSTAPSTALGR